MSDIIRKLTELGAEETDFITLSFTEGTDVWHINESHVEETVGETDTAAMLAGLLAAGVPVYNYGSAILEEMRFNGALDDYDREGGFEEYLTEVLATTIYDGEYGLDYSTEQYDYKRGFCNISTEVQVQVGDLYELADLSDSFVSGFDISVETENGTLTLNAPSTPGVP